MSLEIEFFYDPCNKCGESRQSDFSWNYTYNCADMWRLACPGDKKMIEIDYMLCADAAKKLQAAIDAMIAEPDNYRKLNPSNGYGNYDSFLLALVLLKEACEKEPDAVVETYR